MDGVQFHAGQRKETFRRFCRLDWSWIVDEKKVFLLAVAQNTQRKPTVTWYHNRIYKRVSFKGSTSSRSRRRARRQKARRREHCSSTSPSSCCATSCSSTAPRSVTLTLTVVPAVAHLTQSAPCRVLGPRCSEKNHCHCIGLALARRRKCLQCLPLCKCDTARCHNPELVTVSVSGWPSGILHKKFATTLSPNLWNI